MSVVQKTLRRLSPQRTWAAVLLQKLGRPQTNQAISNLVKWSRAEGGHWQNNARYNPLNTTMRTAHSRPINEVGVKAYRSWGEGIHATAATLHLYPEILRALNQPFSHFRGVVAHSHWGTWK